MAAKRTGFDGFALSDEEADGIAPLVDAVLRQYLPNNSPHAAAYTLAGVLLVTTGVRYMAYLDWRAERVIETPTQVAAAVTAEPPKATQTVRRPPPAATLASLSQ